MRSISLGHGRRWSVVALVVGLIATGCGAEPATQPANVQPATVQVEVYFTNDTLGDPCTDVFPVTRQVDRDDILTGTLNALLAGPTPTEIDDGYDGWFGPTTADALLDAHLDDQGTVHVTFTDLRQLIPNASTSCGSTALLAMLDTTLLALDDITTTRYALADQTAFYAWLQLDDPDAPPSEQLDEPTEPEQPTDQTYDPDAGWSRIELDLPIQLGCCGMQTVGPTSPDGAIPTSGWPAEGYYDVDVERLADPPSIVRMTLRRWVACDDVPELACAPDPATGRIIGDPATEVVRDIGLGELTVVLVPLDPQDLGSWHALLGAPPAFAELLSSGLDHAYITWVYEPHRAGRTAEQIVADLLARSTDPSFPFGDAEPAANDMIFYRGPLDGLLLAHPTWLTPIDRWPPGSNGLYGWRPTLEVRDGAPILYLWANQIAG
jgi:hypothetical protein